MATTTLAELEGVLGEALLAYWDADDLTGLGEGGDVNTWTDQKNGLILTPTGTAPKFTLDYGSLGYAAVDTAGDLSMEVSDAVLNVPCAVLCCFNEQLNPSNADTIWSIGNATNSLLRLRAATARGQYTFQHSNTAQSLTSNAVESADEIHVMSCTYDQAISPRHDRCQIVGRAGAVGLSNEGGHAPHALSPNFWLGKRPVDQIQKYEGGFFAIVIIDQTKVPFGTLQSCHHFFEMEFGLDPFDPSPPANGGGDGGIVPHEMSSAAHTLGA